MNKYSFRLSFLISGIFLISLFTLLFYLIWNRQCLYFAVSGFFNTILSYFYIRFIEQKLPSKKVNLIILGSVFKLFLITLFFITIIYLSDRALSTIFLTFLGLLIAPMTIRVVSYYKTDI